MDRKIMGAIAALGAAAPLAGAQAAVSPAEVHQALHADSYADLLRPVPNATAILRTIDEGRAAKSEEGVQVAQYLFPFVRRDHHHHHRYYDHHHHHRYYRYYDHHHHHHHRYRYNRYDE